MSRDQESYNEFMCHTYFSRDTKIRINTRIKDQNIRCYSNLRDCHVIKSHIMTSYVINQLSVTGVWNDAGGSLTEHTLDPIPTITLGYHKIMNENQA